MLWWLFVLALFYASAKWTAVGTVIRALFFAFGVLGLLLMAQTGYIPVFLVALVKIPIDLVAGVFGIVKALLFP